MSATDPERDDDAEAGAGSADADAHAPPEGDQPSARTPEQTALFETDGPFVWFASTDNLKLSETTVEALARFSPAGPPMLGEIGQAAPARLRDEFGWAAHNLEELQAALSPFGIVLGQPVSAWDLEVGRASDGAFVS